MSAKPNQPGMGDLFANLMKQAQQGQSGEWWQSYHYPETINFNAPDLMGFARSALYAQSIAGSDIVVYESYQKIWEFNRLRLKPELDRSNLDELVKSLDGRLLYDYESFNNNVLFYVFSDGAIEVNLKNNACVYFNCVSLSKKKVDLFNSHYKSCLKNE